MENGGGQVLLLVGINKPLLRPFGQARMLDRLSVTVKLLLTVV